MTSKLELTASQASQQLGVSRAVLRRMVRDGLLAPINAPRPDATKFFAKFNPADVRALAKRMRYGTEPAAAAALPLLATAHANGNGTAQGPAEAAPGDGAPRGITTHLEHIGKRLDEIEARMRMLLAIWK